MTNQKNTKKLIIKLLMVAVAGSFLVTPAIAQTRRQGKKDNSFPVPTPPVPLSDSSQPAIENNMKQQLKPVPHMMKKGIRPTNYILPQGDSIMEHSLIYTTEPEPHEFKQFDHIEVIVDEKGTATSKSLFNRQRNGTFKAELKEWIRLGSSGNARPAAADSPTIDTTLSSRLQSNGQMKDSEGIQFRISARIEEVYPNGTMVIDGTKTITYNQERWEYKVHALIRKEDVSPNNTVLSTKFVNGSVDKNTLGKVYDSTKRPWGVRLMDMLSPF